MPRTKPRSQAAAPANVRRFVIRYLERVPFKVTLLIILGGVFTVGVVNAEMSGGTSWAASGATRLIGLAFGPLTVIGGVAAAALLYRYGSPDE